jgi:hypothetical protein
MLERHAPATCPACGSTDLLLGSWWRTCQDCGEQWRATSGPRSLLAAHVVERPKRRRSAEPAGREAA